MYLSFLADAHAVGSSFELLHASLREGYNHRVYCGFADSSEQLDAACAALTVTKWDASLQEARAARDNICEILHLKLSAATASAEGSAAAAGDDKRSKVSKSKSVNSDELDCYSSLVREAGY
jgi:hypothetical protein